METLTYTGTLTPYIPTTGGDPRLSSSGTIATSSTLTTGIYNLTNNTIMQNKVAVFKVTRDKNEKITKTEFIKELWVETKNGQSVDFQVARDKDLADYEMSDLAIRTLNSVTF
jgi:hypothetical protein